MNRVLQGLLTKFVLDKGRKPNTLEMILLKREAAETGINERKIISMFDRQPVDPNEAIIGGQNLKKEFISETDDEIIARLNKGNEDSLNRLKNKKDEPDDMATGGRAGYYGGGQAMVGEDLSEIGHGSDALMARNMQIAPGGQATTSTGLNYLLGEDNDTVRVPYNEGNMVLPKPKPNADPMVDLLRVYNLYQESMPGVSQDTKKYLKEDFIQKLNNAEISQEAFMTYRMQNNLADGGRAAFGGGGTMGASDKGYQGGGRDTKGNVSGTAPGAAAVGGGSDDRSSPKQNINHYISMHKAQQPKESTLKNIYNTGSEINYLKNIYNKNPVGLGISYGINKFGPSIMEKFKNLRSQADLEEENMKMAELSQTQLGYLNSKKTQRDLKEGFLSPQQIYDKLPSYEEKTPLNPFKGDQEPTSPQEFNEYLDTIDTNKFLERITVAEGGPARQNFKMGKRAFLKLIGSGVAGIASLKTGLLGFGKEGGKKVAKEVVKEATGAPPAYFFKLVDKIKKLGDDAPKLAVKDKENVTTYKDYTLTEDITTGEQTIQRMKIDDDLKYDASEYYGKPVGEEVYMSYRPGKGQMDETTKGKTPPDEYTEDTSLIRSDRPAEGEVMETVSGVPDDIFLEVGEEIPEIIRKEKADGGRIGYAGGKKVVEEVIKKANKKLGKKSVTTADKVEIPKETLLRDMFTDTNSRLNKSTTPESEKIVGDILEETDINSLFDADGKLNKDAVLNAATKTQVQQEGKFTKAEYLIQRIKNTIKENPNDKYIKDTFPGFIKELEVNPDLAKNENVFKELGGDLPEGQQIVVYGDDSIDFFTQKSGPGNIDRLKKLMAKHNISREKALKIMKMEPNDQVMELKMLEVANRKLNATGGLASILR